MAEYRDLAPEFDRIGATIAVLSVDDRRRAAAFRREMHVPFIVLSDPGRQVVDAWDLLNPDLGGIARTATFVIEPDLTISFRSLDETTDRIAATAILNWLRSGGAPSRSSMWSLANFGRVGLSILKHGWLTPRSR